MKKQKKYTYYGIERLKIIINQLIGILGLIFFTAFTTFFVVAGLINIDFPGSEYSIWDDPRITLVCFMVYFLALSGIVCSTFINQLPDIWLDEDGLFITVFLFFKARIYWKDVIDIGSGSHPWGYTLVRTRRITPLHRVYGWLYSRTLYPSFLIGKNISERENLIMEIMRNIR